MFAVMTLVFFFDKLRQNWLPAGGTGWQRISSVQVHSPRRMTPARVQTNKQTEQITDVKTSDWGVGGSRQYVLRASSPSLT